MTGEKNKLCMLRQNLCNKIKGKVLCVAAMLACTSSMSGQMLFRDMNAPMHDRIMDLLGRMTIEEKLKLFAETYQGNERLGLEKYYMGNEALHGVLRPGKFTVFPQAIGLASMWNPEFHQEIASVISDEARARWNELERGKKQLMSYTDLLVFWSPTLNMARDPRWGRTPETYGEDPYLTGVLGTAFVKGLQGNDPRYLKVVATPKHFAGNNEEHNRFSCHAEFTERDLREYYLPGYERAVKEGHAQSIMSAYNTINDVPCTCNPWLLTKVLREEWGFDGYVVSDCGAAFNIYSEHHFTKIPETAAALALKAGLDIECWYSLLNGPLMNAYKQHMVSEAEIDTAAYRVLRSRMRLGIFDDPDSIPYNKIDPKIVGCEKHHEMALEAARQGIVLLKNNNNTLPLKPKRLKKVAVVGINAYNAELGDYSGTPVHEPTIALDAIRNRLGNKVEVYHREWVNVENYLYVPEEAVPQGWKGEYYANANLQGTPAVRTDKTIQFHPANAAPDPFLPSTPLSIRWSGTLVAPFSGEYELNMKCSDGCRVYMDDKLIIDDWNAHKLEDKRVNVSLEAGKEYKFRIEYFDNGGDKQATFEWKLPKGVAEELAKKPFNSYGESMAKEIKTCDAVIAVMGINRNIESEGRDRESLELPENQQRFLRDLYSVNPNVVLVLVAGSPIALNWEDENLPAIIDAWYPGEQGGEAIAEVLFGDCNPSGKLPMTFYRSLDDLPPFNDYDITKGRTYQYFQGEPLYPFGYGLSYTQFKYRDLSIQNNNEDIEVSFTVQNTGKRDGDEISQVYVKYPGQENRPTPIKKLRGFKRTHIAKGKAEKVVIRIPKTELRLWDEQGEHWNTTPKGLYQILVGKSSADIQLSGETTL